MNIVFWNTNTNKNINLIIADIIKNNNCDIFILLEYEDNCEELCRKLEQFGNRFKYSKSRANKNIAIIYKDEIKMEFNLDTDRYCSINVKKVNNEFEFFVVHLPSNLYSDKEVNKYLCNRLMEDVKKTTIPVLILGDFNMNPFDKEMIALNGLFALPDSNYRRKRIYEEEKISLYNPMWKFYGDFKDYPGTYYYDKEQIHCYYWYIYDQVLFTKEINNIFDNESLKIIKETSSYSLVKNGKINLKISDHLPVFFSLKED